MLRFTRLGKRSEGADVRRREAGEVERNDAKTWQAGELRHRRRHSLRRHQQRSRRSSLLNKSQRGEMWRAPCDVGELQWREAIVDKLKEAQVLQPSEGRGGLQASSQGDRHGETEEGRRGAGRGTPWQGLGIP